ncbi:MAG: hypothetical protein IKE69_11845 [Thermoguttaceae bacterium]|nr:hypothetical protein [Thermoguttaceae bacterium]
MKTYRYAVCLLMIVSFSVKSFALDPLPGDPSPDWIPYHHSIRELEESLSVDPEAAVPEAGVMVLYFHRTPGCATCQRMSKMVFLVVKDLFPEEARKKEVILRYYDFEDPKNEKLVKTLGVGSPSLVIIRMKDGKAFRATFADRIWPLSGNSEKFFRYVENEIRKALPNGAAEREDGKTPIEGRAE